MPNARLTAYSVCHFLVDFSCALVLLGRAVPGGDPFVLLLLYNFLAFAVQMPLGLLADRAGRPHLFAAAGCLLAALAWVLPGMAAALAAGMGNALFHVGGGVDTLHREGGKYGALGVFVSPGAFGITLGALWAAQAGAWALPVGLALVLFAAAILFFCPVSPPRTVDLSPLRVPKTAAALACLFLVVVLRSYAGCVLAFPWKGEYVLLFTACVAGGKALGGLLADKFGLRRAAVGSLLLGAGLFLLSDLPAAGLAAVLLFNMTMPLTLGLAAKALPGGRGFAFGLCTFALFLGFLPPFLGWTLPLSGPWAGCLCSLLSLPLLLLGERGGRQCS